MHLINSSLNECGAVKIRICSIINAKYNIFFTEKHNYASEWHGRTCTPSFLVHITVNPHCLTHINKFWVVWLDYSLSSNVRPWIGSLIFLCGYSFKNLFWRLTFFFDVENMNVAVDKWIKTQREGRATMELKIS